MDTSTVSWSARARAYILLLPPGEAFTADDLTREVGQPDEANRIGAYFRKWEGEALIAPSGYMLPSLRPGSKGSKVTVWERVKR